MYRICNVTTAIFFIGLKFVIFEKKTQYNPKKPEKARKNPEKPEKTPKTPKKPDPVGFFRKTRGFSNPDYDLSATALLLV